MFQRIHSQKKRSDGDDLSLIYVQRHWFHLNIQIHNTHTSNKREREKKTKNFQIAATTEQ